MTDIQWQALDIRQKKFLVKQAGYASNCYAYRVFSYLPKMVQLDISYAFMRFSK